MRLKDCHNFKDFRRLAQKRLPSPIPRFPIADKTVRHDILAAEMIGHVLAVDRTANAAPVYVYLVRNLLDSRDPRHEVLNLRF